MEEKEGNIDCGNRQFMAYYGYIQQRKEVKKDDV